MRDTALDTSAIEMRTPLPDVKVIANYLPQYHETPQNDRWWGKGYTDWTGVRKATPVYPGQVQPRVPLDGNYYDLSDPSSIRWQAQIARDHGVWGFGIYHYWFSSAQHYLEKPAELLLANTDIDIHYLFIWDNCSWVRTWSAVDGNAWDPSIDGDRDGQAADDPSVSPEQLENEKRGVLAQLVYGGREAWKEHFDHLLPYFEDPRYMRIDGKPVFAFMIPESDPDTLHQMMDYWDELAQQHGLPGILPLAKASWKRHYFQNEFQYSPFAVNNISDLMVYKPGIMLNNLVPHLRVYGYDRLWRHVIRSAKRCRRDSLFYSGFVGFDDTPRRAGHARIIRGQTPDKFGAYFKELCRVSKSQGKDFVFLTAWNEWGEGAYLEPDEQSGYAYLDALAAAVKEVNGR